MLHVDFHMHSNASDGELAPEALMDLAHERGVGALALTDHDTVAGVERASERAARLGIAFVPGTELSCRYASTGIHLVALGFDIKAPAMRDFLARQRELRRLRSKCFDERFRAIGLTGVVALAEKIAGNAAVMSRSHIASALLEMGVVGDRNEAFERYIGNGKPCFVDLGWPDIREGVEVAHEAGGIIVLAHPGRYRFSCTAEHDAMIEAFRAAGGDGIEVSSGSQHPKCTDFYARVARSASFLASTGSDFHRLESDRPGPGCQPPLPEGLRPVWESPVLEPFLGGVLDALSKGEANPRQGGTNP